MKRFLIWEELTINWENVPYYWEDVAVLNEAYELLSGTRLPDKDPWIEVERKLPKKLAQRFLDIVVRVNGETFKEQRLLEEEKEVSVKNVKKTVGLSLVTVTSNDEKFTDTKSIDTRIITIDHIKRTFDMFGKSKIED